MTKEEKRINIGAFAFILFVVIHFTSIFSQFVIVLALVQIGACIAFLVSWLQELATSKQHLDIIGASMGVALPVVLIYFTLTTVLL